jgi:hypothetical protein
MVLIDFETLVYKVYSLVVYIDIHESSIIYSLLLNIIHSHAVMPKSHQQ